MINSKPAQGPAATAVNTIRSTDVEGVGEAQIPKADAENKTGAPSTDAVAELRGVSDSQKVEARRDDFGAAAMTSAVSPSTDGPGEDFRRLQNVARGASQAVSKGVGLEGMRARALAALQFLGLYGIHLRLSDYHAGKMAIRAYLADVKGIPAADLKAIEKAALKGVQSLVDGPGFAAMDNAARAALRGKIAEEAASKLAGSATNKIPLAHKMFQNVTLPNKVIDVAEKGITKGFPTMNTTLKATRTISGAKLTEKVTLAGLGGCMNWLDELGDSAQMAEKVAKWAKTTFPSYFRDPQFQKGVVKKGVTIAGGEAVNLLTKETTPALIPKGIWNHQITNISKILGGIGQVGVQGIRLMLKLVPVIAWAGVAVDAVRLRDTLEDPTSSDARKAWAVAAVATGAGGIILAQTLVAAPVALGLAGFSVLAGYMRETSKEAVPA